MKRYGLPGYVNFDKIKTEEDFKMIQSAFESLILQVLRKFTYLSDLLN